jgi:hypothetical protein
VTWDDAGNVRLLPPKDFKLGWAVGNAGSLERLEAGRPPLALNATVSRWRQEGCWLLLWLALTRCWTPCAEVSLDAQSRLPLDSVRFCMMFKPENASATTIKLGFPAFVEAAAGTLLPHPGRDRGIWGAPGWRVELV